MFDMQLSWWEFIVRGVVVYCVLLLMVRLSGKRTVGQFTPFDLLVVMLLSEAVSNSLSGGDNSLVGGLIIAATLIALNLGIGFATTRSRKIENLIEGTAVLLGRDGQVFNDVMRRSRVGEADIEEALREANCSIKDMKYLFLEADGSISVLKNQE
jgi:uncharacterized membrane protein YcaP (DUF421 family)